MDAASPAPGSYQGIALAIPQALRNQRPFRGWGSKAGSKIDFSQDLYEPLRADASLIESLAIPGHVLARQNMR